MSYLNTATLKRSMKNGKADVEMNATISRLSQIFAGEISPSAGALVGGVELKGKVKPLDDTFGYKRTLLALR